MRNLVWLLLLWTGCQLNTADPLEVARDEVARGRLLHALLALDHVSPTDRRHLEARNLAAELERRVRRGCAQLLQGLDLRDELRDKAAVVCFRDALQSWPDAPGVRELIRLTELRVHAFPRHRAPTSTAPVARAVPRPTPPSAPPPSPEPAVQPEAPAAGSGTGDTAGGETVQPPSAVPDSAAPPAAVPGGETGPRPESGQPVAAPNQPAAAGPDRPASPDRPAVRPMEKKRRQWLLAQATTLMRDGAMDRAVDILEDLHRDTPEDRGLARHLARVHHQRALLAYGEGRLGVATKAWERVVELTPDNTQALEYLRATRKELDSRGR